MTQPNEPFPSFFSANSISGMPSSLCNCIGGENCCIKRGQRDREAAIRVDERLKALEELRRSAND